MPPDTSKLWFEGSNAAVLQGLKCSSCGLILFPPQRYGCPGCGAISDQLEEVELPAVGRLHSFAVVNLHQVHKTPYTIIEVELDSGPLIRALFNPDAIPTIDDRVLGRAEGANGENELVFMPVREAKR